MASLTGRAYIVSGGLSGIGRSATLKLAAAGAHVWVADVSPNIPSEFRSNSQIHIPNSPTDIRSRAACRALAQLVQSTHNRLDGLVNCAGICPTEPPLTSSDTLDSVFQSEFDINVRGTWNLGTEALLQMQTQEKMELGGRGVIVNIGSIAAERGIAGLGIYCMTKHAVLGLTRSWALEWAKEGIRVNAVAPGVTKTPMYDEQFKNDESGDVAQGLINSIPMGRVARPEDISATILFLLSDEASYTTGQILTVSGGG